MPNSGENRTKALRFSTITKVQCGTPKLLRIPFRFFIMSQYNMCNIKSSKWCVFSNKSGIWCTLIYVYIYYWPLFSYRICAIVEILIIAGPWYMLHIVALWFHPKCWVITGLWFYHFCAKTENFQKKSFFENFLMIDVRFAECIIYHVRKSFWLHKK